MGICEDRITKDSTEFEKAFLKIYDGSLWTALDKMKDWQPPKPQQTLPVVPELTQKQADTLNDYKNGSGSLVNYLSTEIKKGDYDYFARAWLDGYTVEKEKLFYLKNKNTGHILYRQPKEAGGDLIEVVATINEEYTWFTQDEIDTMHTGSYEQIAVKVDEVEP